MKRTVAVLMLPIVVSISLLVATGQTTQEEAKEKRIAVSQLPAAVAQAIKANCARCSIDKATVELENGVTVYDIEFKHRQGEIAVAADGSLIDRETVVRLTDVPAAALEAIRKNASGSKIKQVAKGEVHAELKDGAVIKLAGPKYLYEAELAKGNEVAEIEVTPEGQVTEAPQWRKKSAKEN